MYLLHMLSCALINKDREREPRLRIQLLSQEAAGVFSPLSQTSFFLNKERLNLLELFKLGE